MDYTEKLHIYARMLMETGLNIEKGQEVSINAAVDCAPFVRILTEEAYKLGATEVFVNWTDTECDRLKYQYASETTLSTVPDWLAEKNNSFARKGGAMIRLTSEDPSGFKDVDPKKVALSRTALSKATAEARNARNNGLAPWLVAAFPGEKWATTVFPGIPAEEAMDQLLSAILHATRADQPDPAAAWQAHQADLDRRIKWLNDKAFTAMHYRSSSGTDFTVGLVKDHLWAGGGAVLKNGRGYIPNMPTEEVFSMPDCRKAEGTLVASLPLNHDGSLIRNFRLSFKDGSVIDYDAEIGKETLRSILDMDEGTKRLGEIALIPADSPISDMGLLFYNTLFDENASCHFALGASYPECIRGGGKMTSEELLAHGGNDSLAHVDFMIGTKDLSITGITEDGKEIPVFTDGIWAF